MGSLSSLAKAMRHIRKELGGTSNIHYLECLIGIGLQEGITQSGLRTLLGTQESVVSRISQQLETMELIIRNPHPTEYRSKTLYLTNKGKKLLKDALELLE